MSRLVLVQGPMVPLLALDQVKTALRIDTSADDTYLESLIDGARAALDGADGLLGRALDVQTWRLDMQDFADEVELPLPPLIDVLTIDYLDLTNTRQTLSTSVYRVIEGGYTRRGSVILAENASWPTVYPGQPDGVRITFQCGYASEASPGDSVVPEPIRQAARLMIRRWYDNPQNRDIDEAIINLLYPYKVALWGGVHG
jgi:uncharacterized phiE125 gp8 family phage protein